VAILITLLAVAALRVERKEPEHKAPPWASCLALLKNGYVLAMVAAIFLYVGAEVCVSAGIPLYLKERFDIDITVSASSAPACSSWPSPSDACPAE